MLTWCCLRRSRVKIFRQSGIFSAILYIHHDRYTIIVVGKIGALDGFLCQLAGPKEDYTHLLPTKDSQCGHNQLLERRHSAPTSVGVISTRKLARFNRVVVGVLGVVLRLACSIMP